MADHAKIRFGLVGCGRISGNHIRAIREHAGRAELVCAADADPEARARVASKFGVETTDRYEALLARDDVDAVAVCTPSGLHPEHGILAAKAGKHVVTEKPIATSLPACDELIRTCDDCGVRLFVVMQNRLNVTMQLLKAAVEKGRFGQIYGAYCNVFWQRPQSYYDLAGWRGTRSLDGGAFLNQASHYVDSLLWLMGDVDQVQAVTATLGRDIESEDSGSVLLRFANGAIGAMNVSMLTYPKNLEGSVTILGEHGTVKLGGVAINQFEKWEFADYDDDDKQITETNYQPPNVYGFGHAAYYHNVIRVLQGEDVPETDGRSGRKSLELILAIHRASETGTVVQLPLEPMA